MKRIKLLFMDVDGTLTDGKIYMGENGEVMKAFDIKDGYGINELLPKYGIIPVIITGRTSRIVENRAKELHIYELYQGKHDKLETMQEVMKKYNSIKEEVAYIGDDVLDICCMENSGIKGCPADAVKEVKEISDYICIEQAGHGAVREFIQFLISR